MKKVVIHLLTLALLISPALFLAASGAVHAQVGSAGGSGQTTGVGTAGGNGQTTNSGSGLQNPLTVSSFPEFLTAILKGVVELGAIFLTVMIVYVGFLFVAAQGNAEKLSSARTALIWTIIGGLILLGAEGISLVIQNTVSSITS